MRGSRHPISGRTWHLELDHVMLLGYESATAGRTVTRSVSKARDAKTMPVVCGDTDVRRRASRARTTARRSTATIAVIRASVVIHLR